MGPYQSGSEIPGQGFEPRFYGPEPHVLPVGRPRSDRHHGLASAAATSPRRGTSCESYQLFRLAAARHRQKLPTILSHVGYNEVERVRQAGKSTAYVTCLFLDNLAISLVASP
jgi:hypothetical protein